MKRLEEAREGFRRRDLEKTMRAHDPGRIAAEEPHEQERGRYLGEAVYGALDGIVTTFAVVAGVAGAALAAPIVLIMGLANLLGDGFSMAAGAYLGERSSQDYEREERAREEWEVDHFPEGERHEIREIYRAKGFEGEDLERAVAIITADRKRWVETMMREELSIIPERKSPLRAALITFLSFLAAGAIPLVAFIGSRYVPGLEGRSFETAVVITLAAVFAVGSARSLVTHKPWHRAGFEMLLVGGLAASVAYGVGFMLRGLV